MILSDNAKNVLEKRYFQPEETTWEDVVNRVASAIALDASQRSDFYRVIHDMRFLPNSPTLMNSGTDIGMLSACFVLPIEDDMESIFDAVKHAALIHKAGGGTGFNFSHIRAEGSKVGSTGGIASGPISFMKVFNAATDVIKQGGKRRGANMAILNVDHQDIDKFIRCKEDEGQLANFNISVAVTDAFMEKAERVGTPEHQRLLNIAERAWANGEPGLIFIDTVNRNNPTPELGPLEATNPCLAGDSWVYTNLGMRKIEWLTGAPGVLVDSRMGEDFAYQAIEYTETGSRPIFLLQTREGYALRLTSDHMVMTARGWVKACELNENEGVYIYTGEGAFGVDGTIEEGELLGWMVGDGYLTEDGEAHLDFYAEKQFLVPKYQEMIEKLPNSKKRQAVYLGGDKVSLKSVQLVALANRFGYDDENKVSVTDRVMASSRAFQTGFLRALFTADGHVEVYTGSRNSVRLTSVSYEMLQNVQRMLLNFGIFSRIYKNRTDERYKPMPDGKGGMKEYLCQACHTLVITGAGIRDFRDMIGFSLPRKASLLNKIMDNYTRGPYGDGDAFVAHFESLTPDGEGMVYDITEPITHSFVANGIVVHNCGETPLYPYESCNLGSINLAEHVEDGRINWEKLNETTRIATRFLNNVIDANKYPMPEIEEATKRTRKIGLGVMGWADALIKMGIPYDSEEARDMANEVMRRIRSVAFDESAINSTLTTIAPTGTISIIAGCSSGIEPLFALAYTRKNVLDGKPMKEVHPLFLEEARKLGFYSDELIEHVKEHGSIAGREDVPERVRELFKTAHEISAESHILMQAAFQEYTDNAVSKTINFPHDATVEDVFKAYMLAWKKQCKGITIYRDNSRERQVLNVGVKEEKEEEAQEVVAPRTRPPTTYGVTEKYKLGCGRSLYVTINEDDDGMCEVFTQVGKSGGCMSAWSESLGRMISIAMRAGVDVKSIVKQLTGIRCSFPTWKDGKQIFSCADAIGKAIEEYRYVNEDFAVEMLELTSHMNDGRDDPPECPECGGTLTIGEGCMKCESCGYTKCG